MLDWNNSPEVQSKGIKLAESIKDINAFLLPCVYPSYSKNVWGNCAIILSKKSDDELRPYLTTLFEWLQDLNWPGACTILERLQLFSGEKLKEPLEKVVIEADKMNNFDGRKWLDNLSELLDNESLKEDLLSPSIIETLQAHYHKYGDWDDEELEQQRL